MLQEMAFFAASAVLPTSSGNFGFVTKRFGNSDYNETETGIAYGRKLGEKVAVGAQFNYYNLKVAGYGNSNTISVDASASFQFSEEMRGGFHVYKSTGASNGKHSGVNLASVYEIGFGYDASGQLFLTAIASKMEGRNVQVNAALQYAFADNLLCKAGVTSGTSSFYIGAGVKLKNFRLDAVSSFHPQLGITPGILLLFYSPGQ